MSTLHWQSLQMPDLDREYVVALSQYAWGTHVATLGRLSLKRHLQEHLRAAHGLLGYAIWTEVRHKRFYILAVWEDEQALVNFGDPIPQETVRSMPPRADTPTWFLSWRIASELYPPTWHEAFAKAIAAFPGKLVP
jgi:hypothetical protein